jgi:hypothetical protein
MPAVAQPVSEVDRSKVDKMVGVHFTITTWSTAATLSCLISLKTSFTRKEDMKRVIYSIYKQ